MTAFVRSRSTQSNQFRQAPGIGKCANIANNRTTRVSHKPTQSSLRFWRRSENGSD